MKEQKIGFIGLGNMGAPMAKNLVKAGYGLTVFDAVDKAVEEIAAVGAKRGASPKELAEKSDIVILSLPTSKIIESVVLGENGVAEGLRAGSILIDMSSAEPSSTRKIAKILAEKGVDMMDAAISGGPAGASERKMSIMAGGQKEVFEKYRFILDELGNNVFLVGAIGAGHTLKSVNNLLYGAIFVASCEAVVLGVKAGLDPSVMLDVISKSAGRNFAVDVKFKTNVLSRDFKPGFSLDLLHKDMAIALNMAKELNYPISLCSYAQDIITEGQIRGYGKHDHSEMVKKYEEFADVVVKGQPCVA
ncbi:NAD(P)-dependent oxidoreductase [Synergistes jonesii]|uniref:NAD(P)-dependent oxidoreductase n=1 Tax=Synergistes jonesii TaxID=2754 RepID=UPI00242D9BDA|nr:NAD(P)-dependent oxidoreductase [Synergistes jonesii]